MVKVLIICAGGMSSSLIAKKTTELLKSKGHDIEVDATGCIEGPKRIADGSFDLYLVSPQTKMYYQKFSEAAERSNRKIAQIPPQAYVPIPMGIEKMAALVLEQLG